MIGLLALETGIAPSVLWRENPIDLATIVDVLEERSRRHG
jgi:hypothetical protein